MFLSDLQNKDIINTKNGKQVGRIIDVEITTEGTILNLIVESKRNIKMFMTNAPDTKIPYENISKIGEDVILVNL